MIKTKTITAVERDGLDFRVLTLCCEIPDENFNIVKALKDAATEFVQTPEGKEIYGFKHEHFNLVDIAYDLPNNFCEKYSFRIIALIHMWDVAIDWDYDFVDKSKTRGVS